MGIQFYYSRLSYREINPFAQTDCDGFAESGDAFLVYPDKNGKALPSLRLKVLRDAFTDNSMLKLCESLCGREEVDKVIREYIGECTFTDYTHSNLRFLSFREKIHSMIEEKTMPEKTEEA